MKYFLGYLIEKLTERGLYDKVNIIITSDHGMTSISNDRKVVLGSVLDWNKIQHYVNIGIATEVWPQPGKYKIRIDCMMEFY